jgi:hypothetical protein
VAAAFMAEAVQFEIMLMKVIVALCIREKTRLFSIGFAQLK